MTTQQITFKDTKITYYLQGEGPCVVLLHGFLENSSMWQFLLPYLPKGKRYIAIDLPGHGSSDCIGYVHTMEEMAELVNTVLIELGVRKCILIGHSLGGYVTLAFAEMYPEKFKKGVLLHSTAHADSEERKANREKAADIARKNPKLFARTLYQSLFASENVLKEFEQDIKNQTAEAEKTSAKGIVAALNGMKMRPDREVLLHFASGPFLLIIGSNDPIIPLASYSEQMKARNAQSVLIPCGHMGHIEAREEVAKALKGFLN